MMIPRVRILFIASVALYSLACDNGTTVDHRAECLKVYDTYSKTVPRKSSKITATINGMSFIYNVDTTRPEYIPQQDVVHYKPCPFYEFSLRLDSISFKYYNVKGIGEFSLSERKVINWNYLIIGGHASVWGYFGNKQYGSYSTSNQHKGKLTITNFDPDSMSASGTFEFDAFDSTTMQSVSVRNGVFTNFRVVPEYY